MEALKAFKNKPIHKGHECDASRKVGCARVVGPASFTNIVGLGAYNKVLNLSPEQPLTMTFSLANGRFQGSVTLTNAGQRVTRSFKGAVLQRQNFGSGYFLGTNQSGRAYLGPLFP